MTIPDIETPLDWTLDEERFRFLFGPFYGDGGDAAWAIYEPAKAERIELGYDPDLSIDDPDDDDFLHDIENIRSWAHAQDRTLNAMDEAQTAGFVTRLMACFVDDIKETFGMLDMVEQRVPATKPAIAEQRAHLVEVLEQATHHFGRFSQARRAGA